MLRYVKKAVQGLLDVFGFEIRRKNDRTSLIGLLMQARQAGFRPQTVLDVGAAWGNFTTQCYAIFPEARYLLVEPLKEYQDALQQLSIKLPNVNWVSAAAAAEAGTLTLNIHRDLMGSSLLLENEESDVNGSPRPVEVLTLDGLVAKHDLKPPFFLKLDVQGAELKVLTGAEGVLREAEYILLEVSLFEFFVGGPLLHDIVAFLKSRGFVAYDLGDGQYRPLDNALGQLDMAFVKENGLFRQQHFYATAQQREAQNKRLLSQS